MTGSATAANVFKTRWGFEQELMMCNSLSILSI
nr:MAG TPA: hypothetical protein [Caudoviricetes sp.]